MPWFGVKTLVRIRPAGRPRKRDSQYRANLAIVEEVVMVFEAKNSKAAIKKARTDMRKLSRPARSPNAYGQTIAVDLLDYAEAFPMFEPLGNGAAVFGSSEIVKASEPPAKIIQRKIGARPGSAMRMFVEAEIAPQLDKLPEAARRRSG